MVGTGLGQSGFRCDLALRAPGATAWHTIVLVDQAALLDRGSVEQRRIVWPAVPAAAGWHVEQVLGVEWLERPEEVLDRLVAAVEAGGTDGA